MTKLNNRSLTKSAAVPIPEAPATPCADRDSALKAMGGKSPSDIFKSSATKVDKKRKIGSRINITKMLLPGAQEEEDFCFAAFITGPTFHCRNWIKNCHQDQAIGDQTLQGVKYCKNGGRYLSQRFISNNCGVSVAQPAKRITDILKTEMKLWIIVAVKRNEEPSRGQLLTDWVDIFGQEIEKQSFEDKKDDDYFECTIDTMYCTPEEFYFIDYLEDAPENPATVRTLNFSG